jgi:hypothetical protein
MKGRYPRKAGQTNSNHGSLFIVAAMRPKRPLLWSYTTVQRTSLPMIAIHAHLHSSRSGMCHVAMSSSLPLTKCRLHQATVPGQAISNPSTCPSTQCAVVQRECNCWFISAMTSIDTVYCNRLPSTARPDMQEVTYILSHSDRSRQRRGNEAAWTPQAASPLNHHSGRRSSSVPHHRHLDSKCEVAVSKSVVGMSHCAVQSTLQVVPSTGSCHHMLSVCCSTPGIGCCSLMRGAGTDGVWLGIVRLEMTRSGVQPAAHSVVCFRVAGEEEQLGSESRKLLLAWKQQLTVLLLNRQRTTGCTPPQQPAQQHNPPPATCTTTAAAACTRHDSTQSNERSVRT